MKLSIDPGNSCTGVVFWPEYGKPYGKAYWQPKKGRSAEQKRKMTIDKLVKDIAEIHTTDPIIDVVIEDFVRAYNVNSWTIRPLERFTGMIQGAVYLWCFIHAPEAVVRSICKGNAQKSEAAMLARSLGFESDNGNVLDAFHIGILAGFR